MSHTQEIKIGDRIQYKSKFDLTFIVTEIHEKRVAKGNHPSAETLFYDLSLKYKIHEQ